MSYYHTIPHLFRETQENVYFGMGAKLHVGRCISLKVISNIPSALGCNTTHSNGP